MAVVVWGGLDRRIVCACASDTVGADAVLLRRYTRQRRRTKVRGTTAWRCDAQTLTVAIRVTIHQHRNELEKLDKGPRPPMHQQQRDCTFDT